MTETKREVFGQLLKAYQDLISKENDDENYRVNITTPLNVLYAAALPDDLPVIPKAISEYIKNLRKYHRDLVDVFGMVRDLGITRTEPTGVLVWVAHNTDAFARAWLLGVWRVEETGEIVKFEEEK